MHDLTTGPILRHLLNTGGFMLFSMMFQTLYFLTDLYWMGRLGSQAVAAVGVAGNLMFVVLALTQMLAVGTTTLVAHATGRRDRDGARRVFNQAQSLSMLVGVLFVAAALALTPAYADAFAADAATAALVRQFLWWFIPALALQFLMVALAAALRGIGDFKPGMIVQSASVALNMALAPFLIFGWGTGYAMGVAGAAVASLISVAVAVVWLSRYVERPDSYLHFRRAEMAPDLATWKRLLGIGLPAGVEFALMAVYIAIVYAVSRPFGAAAQAGFGIGQRVVQAGFMPIVALGFAVAPVAGQNFGARLGARVRETFAVAAALAVGGMLVLVGLCHLAPAALIGVFSTDPAVVAVGEDYLRIVSWNFVASGIVFVASSMFQAMGNTLPSLATSAVRVVVVAIPVFLLARRPDFTLQWVWYLTVASVTLQMLISLALLRREFRRRLAFAAPPAAAPAAGLAT
jgi:putative MATE family efflux protein